MLLYAHYAPKRSLGSSSSSSSRIGQLRIGGHAAVNNAHEAACVPSSWRAAALGTRNPFASQPAAAPVPRGLAGHAVRAEQTHKHAGHQQQQPTGWGSSSEQLKSHQQLFQTHQSDAAAPPSEHHQRWANKQRPAAASAAPAGDSSTTTVRFSIVRAVEYGQALRVVGCCPALGSWDASKGCAMEWHEGHKWTADTVLAVSRQEFNTKFEFKFVVVHRSGSIEWEGGPNRVLLVPTSAAAMQVQGAWGNTQDTDVLELQERSDFTQRRQLLQQLLNDATSAVEEDAGAASAAAAAETLLSILDFQEQQRTPQDYGATAGGNTAAAVPLQPLQQQQQQQLTGAGPAAATGPEPLVLEHREEQPGPEEKAEQEEEEQQQQRQQQQQQVAAGPTAAATGTDASYTTSSRHSSRTAMNVPPDATGSSGSGSTAVGLSRELSGTHQQLVAMLLDMRTELTSSIGDVAAAMREVQDELGQVQQQVAQLTAERLLLQQQQLPGLPSAAAAATAAAAASLMDAIDGDANRNASWATQDQLVQPSSSGGSAEEDGTRHGSSSYKIRWRSDSSSQQQHSSGDTAAAAGRPGASYSSPYTEVQLEPEPAPELSPAALNGLHSAVLSWRQEVLTFRQESMLLRAEVSSLASILTGLEQQLAANTAAIQSLHALVSQQQGGSGQQPGTSSSTSRADGTSGDNSNQSAATAVTAAAAAPAAVGSAAVGIAEDELRVRFDQLAAGLTAEVNHALQAATAAAQHDPLQQPVQQQMPHTGILQQPPEGVSPPQAPLQQEEWQQQAQHLASTPLAAAASPPQQHRRKSRASSSSSSSGGSSGVLAAAAAAHLLSSNNVLQYHKGLLLCVMLSAGLWQEGLTEAIKGEPMRLTWRAYRSAFSDQLLTSLKQQLTTPQQVLAELQSSSRRGSRHSSRAEALACHVLWSLRELSTHSSQFAALLQGVCSSQEARLMQQLQPGSTQQGCTAVLLRWMAAAATAHQQQQ